MNTTTNERAEARSRANRRLRTMTIGTALLAVAATGGFGTLAAAGSLDAGAATTTTSMATDAATVVTADAATTSTTVIATTPTVTAVSGGAHASTGGS